MTPEERAQGVMRRLYGLIAQDDPVRGTIREAIRAAEAEAFARGYAKAIEDVHHALGSMTWHRESLSTVEVCLKLIRALAAKKEGT